MAGIRDVGIKSDKFLIVLHNIEFSDMINGSFLKQQRMIAGGSK